MDANFDLSYDMSSHLSDSVTFDEINDENNLDILQSLFAEEIVMDEITNYETTSIVQDACASTSTHDADIELREALSIENKENFSVPKLPAIEKKRFKTVTDNELREMEEKRHSVATQKATKWGVKAFQEWSLETFGVLTDLKIIAPEELANKLGKFYAEATPKPNQKRSENLREQANEYHKNSFKSIRSALNRHLQDLGRDFDIVRDRQFRKCNSILDGKLKKNVQEGLARPTKHKQVIPAADLEKISTYIYDTFNPVSLRFRIWFILSMHFVSRGLEFHEQLKLNSLVFSCDENGSDYVTLSHTTKEKNWQGGIDSAENSKELRMYSVPSAGEKCPVKSLRLYLSKINPDATYLFNQCSRTALSNPHTENIWYTNIPLKHYQFTRFMSDIAKNASCSQTYTAHCLRATAIQGMNDAGFEIRHIMHMSGHKNEASVRSYNRDCSTSQKKNMSDALCGIMNPNLKIHNAELVSNANSNRLTSQSRVDQPTSSVSGHPLSRAQPPVDYQIESSVSMQSSHFMSSGFMANSAFNNCTFNFSCFSTCSTCTGIMEILERNGYTLTRFSDEKNSFYYVLHSVIKSKAGSPSSKDAMQIRDDLFKFEEQNSLYFRLFLPPPLSYDKTRSSKDCLHGKPEWLKKGNKSPSPREIFAAAELLQKCICVIRFDQSLGHGIRGFQGYIFAPAIRQCMDAEPLCILMVEKQDGAAEFIKVDLKDHAVDFKSCPGILRNEKHRNCFGLRFTNNFFKLFNGNITYGAKDDVKDLYRRLSLEFYGTEEHHNCILNIICNFELEPDNLELFSKYADNTVNDETDRGEKERLLRIHIDNSRQRLKPPGEGELYALSSVFNVDIVVDKTGRGDWDTYLSVACTYASCFDSTILLRKQTEERHYMPYVTTPDECSCCQRKPECQGHIGMIKENVHKVVLKNPCCPAKGNHQNHTHLNHVPNARTFWPQRTDHLYPTNEIQVASVRLAGEERRIDQINGGNGTLNNALAKELYGDENKYFSRDLQSVLGNERDEMDEKMQKISDRLRVPIYVFHGTAQKNQFNSSQGFFWTRFEPSSQHNINKDCRFYITLFHNRLNGSLDLITPLRGCNCQLPPPLSLLRDHQKMESQLLLCVDPKQRHHPLVTFFSVDPSEEMFTIEIRDFPVCPPYSPMRIAMQREDMKERTLYSVQFYEHSLIRCLSKEVFGTEQNYATILKELCNEILRNIQTYLAVFGKDLNRAYDAREGKSPLDETDHEKLAKFIIDRIEDDLPSDDLLLWVACTYFQTSIYVLRVADSESSTESFWKEYSKLKIKSKDSTKSTRFERICAQSKLYYISLLQTGSKQFHRIVPKMDCCNCVVDIPIVGSKQADSTKYYTQQEICSVVYGHKRRDEANNFTGCHVTRFSQ